MAVNEIVDSFTMYAGDSKTITIPVTNPSGVALDVTGAVFTYALKNIDNGQVMTKAVEVVDAVNGMVQVKLEPSDTEIDTEALIYKQELQMVDVVGDVSTVLRGYITIINDIA